ncbi:hypothetical protein SOASR030_32490 [Leminorella grimontii]|uniref:Uncharacterized protein n=1 Tax=Leminorella grimontii TaxID=82981 RepID=A0AAV5N9J2_9GAMM|nr:hypothetical protein SOASR030_32490 [Leminorella grimontii]GKX60098.1 hypothetical protein SOASR031_24130 [Leminorella grimontii]
MLPIILTATVPVELTVLIAMVPAVEFMTLPAPIEVKRSPVLFILTNGVTVPSAIFSVMSEVE